VAVLIARYQRTIRSSELLRSDANHQGDAQVGGDVRYKQLDTMGDLRRCGGAVEYCCSRCGGTRLFDAHQLPFGDLQSIATVHRRMHCSQCGEQGAGSFTRAWFRDQHPQSLDTAL